MENIEEQLLQIDAVIEILKDVRPLCEDPETAGLVASALDGAQTLQHMMLEAKWPGLPEMPVKSALPFLAGENADPAELCFPV